MATTPISSSSSQDSATAAALSNSGLGNLKLDDFLKMLLTELQNQDPLSPMDSSQMLTQIGQITQVGATKSLTETLDSVLLGQSLGNATALIGKTVSGLDDDGKDVTGKVDKVTLANGQPVLNIGEKTVQLKNVRAVLPNGTDAAAAVPVSAPAVNSTDSATRLQQLLQQLQQSSQIQPTKPTT